MVSLGSGFMASSGFCCKAARPMHIKGTAEEKNRKFVREYINLGVVNLRREKKILWERKLNQIYTKK